jgi:hypothetical protein
LELIYLEKEIKMNKNEFVQLAGCADGWMINRAGVVKSASGNTLIVSPAGNVTVKLVNGNNRAVKIAELLERNFGLNAVDSEVTNTVESNGSTDLVSEATQEDKIVPESVLMRFSVVELEAEISRRKLQFIDEVVLILNKANIDYGRDVVDAAIAKFAGI